MAKKKTAKPEARKSAAKDSSPRRASTRKSPARKKAPAQKPAAQKPTAQKPTGGKAKAGKAGAKDAAVRPPLAKAKETRAPENRRDGSGPGKAAGKSGKVARPPSRRIAASELTRIRQFLSQKKVALTNHLQTELSELEKPEKRHRTDLEEIASDTHDTDSLCEIMDIEAHQIGQIDLALAKLDNGTYGICEDCSGEIPLVRLQALPFATQCIDCKRKAEIQGQISASDSRLG